MLATFPLDPSLSSCILASQELGCTEELLTITAVLSVDSLTYIPSQLKEKSKDIIRKYMSSEGDFISMLLFFQAFKKSSGNADWCRKHFINLRNVKTAQQIRTQLRGICDRLNITLKSCGTDYSLVRKALVAGLFTNSAERQQDGSYLTILTKQPVHIHPSSVLFNMKPGFVVFNELVKTSKCSMRDLCIIDPLWLVNICPSHFDSRKFKMQAVTS